MLSGYKRIHKVVVQRSQVTQIAWGRRMRAYCLLGL